MQVIGYIGNFNEAKKKLDSLDLNSSRSLDRHFFSNLFIVLLVNILL
jgi:hypothetical protein